jgi:hypothetical protein
MMVARRTALLVAASVLGTVILPQVRGLGRIRAPAPRLDTTDIVRLHLEQLARCGVRGAERARRLRPPLLAAAERVGVAPSSAPAEAAFALIEQWGEFPRFPGGPGGAH